MSKKYANSTLYHKARAFEEIQEVYKLYCLEHGYNPIQFVRERGSEDNYHGDYGLCAAVIAEAQKLKNAGAGKIIFTAASEKETDAKYSYRVNKKGDGV